MRVILALCVILAAAACSQDTPTQPSAAGTDPGASQAIRLPGSDQGGRPLSTLMTGAAEAPGPGDPDGRGTATLSVNRGQGEVCFELTVENIAPATAAHVHRAEVGVPGPVVIPLTPPTSGRSSGCVDVAAPLIDALMDSPEAFYVNVHNADFGPGAVRGQLAK